MFLIVNKNLSKNDKILLTIGEGRGRIPEKGGGRIEFYDGICPRYGGAADCGDDSADSGVCTQGAEEADYRTGAPGGGGAVLPAADEIYHPNVRGSVFYE